MEFCCNLKEDVYQPVGSASPIVYYRPIIDLIVQYKHKVSSAITCQLDTGATVNVFPAELATVFLGISDSALLKGRKINLTGIGSITGKAYGYQCTLQHPEFRMDGVWIYFMYEHRAALLGCHGFMNRFDSITINEKEKKTIFVNPR